MSLKSTWPPKTTWPVRVYHASQRLFDLSVTGAQVLLPTRVRPNEPVRLVLSDEAHEGRVPGRIVWSVAVPTGGSIQYRAGVKLSKPNAKWIESFCQQAGGRPDLTFGAE